MFIDCSRLIEHNPPHSGHGVTVTDVDGDGLCEVLVTGYGMANRVLKWTGHALRERTDGTLADPLGRTTCVIAADLDGDGREELYACNDEDETGQGADHADRLFASFGTRWIDLLTLPENAAIAETTAGMVAAAVDRLGRGRYGFVVVNDGAPITLFELDGQGRLVDVAEDAGLDQAVDAVGLVALPLVSDHMDLFIQAAVGGNCLFRNFGDGTFEEVSEKRGVADVYQRGRGVTALDAGGNGQFDLICAVWQGSHRLFLQRSGGAFTEEASSDLSLPSHAMSVLAADFDNDGFEEILFLNHGQPNRLFAFRHDQWSEVEIGDAAQPRAFCAGAAVADLDGDGVLELVVNHSGPGQPLALFKASSGNHKWLRIAPLTAAGAPARGAIVICTTGSRVQRRTICAGSGYRSQMEPVAHFGLGRVERVDTVEVQWPDGMMALIDEPPINQVLTVPYPPV